MVRLCIRATRITQIADPPSAISADNMATDSPTAPTPLPARDVPARTSRRIAERTISRSEPKCAACGGKHTAFDRNCVKRRKDEARRKEIQFSTPYEHPEPKKAQQTIVDNDGF